MISRSSKLNLRQQDSFFKTAQRLSRPQFTLLWKENEDRLLFQVVITRGTVKTAVERNTLKRAVYDICAQLLKVAENSAKSIVIVVRNSQIQVWQDQLTAELEKIVNDK